MLCHGVLGRVMARVLEEVEGDGEDGQNAWQQHCSKKRKKAHVFVTDELGSDRPSSLRQRVRST